MEVDVYVVRDISSGRKVGEVHVKETDNLPNVPQGRYISKRIGRYTSQERSNTQWHDKKENEPTS